MGTTPRSVPIQSGRRKIWRYVFSAGGLAAIALAYFVVPPWWNKRERAKWHAAVHAREAKQAEFAHWLEAGTCVRQGHCPRDPLQATREKIRAVQETHAAKHDYIWWQLQLGFRLEDLLDRAYAAHAAGGDIAAAIRVPLTTLQREIADAQSAYIPIARVPELDELERAKPDTLWDVVQRVPDNGEWSDIAHDNMVYGPMPPEPEGCNISDEE